MNTRRRSAYMENMLSDFYDARQAWWEAAEYATCLYATELAEYKELHPMPQLKDYMRAARAERELIMAQNLREAAELAALEAEHDAAEDTREAYSVWLADEAAALTSVAPASVPSRVATEQPAGVAVRVIAAAAHRVASARAGAFGALGAFVSAVVVVRQMAGAGQPRTPPAGVGRDPTPLIGLRAAPAAGAQVERDGRAAEHLKVFAPRE